MAISSSSKVALSKADHVTEKRPQEAENFHVIDSQEITRKEVGQAELQNEETETLQAMQAKGLTNGHKDSSVSSKVKTPSQLSQASKTTASQNKSNLKSPGSTAKSVLSSKSGFTSKKV
jgi:hypothetical protein